MFLKPDVWLEMTSCPCNVHLSRSMSLATQQEFSDSVVFSRAPAHWQQGLQFRRKKNSCSWYWTHHLQLINHWCWPLEPLNSPPPRKGEGRILCHLNFLQSSIEIRTQHPESEFSSWPNHCAVQEDSWWPLFKDWIGTTGHILKINSLVLLNELTKSFVQVIIGLFWKCDTVDSSSCREP